MLTWHDNIKLDLKNIGCEGVDWIQTTKNRVHWQALQELSSME
jgi:hypothetical protein